MALSNSILTRFAAAAATSDSAARKQGSTYSLGNLGRVGEAEARRKRLLQEAVSSGKIKPESLGPNDAASLGFNPKIKMAQGGHHFGILGKAFGGATSFLGNLGSDIYQAARYIPAGAYNLGKAVYEDKMDPMVSIGANKGHVRSEIIDPTISGYKETYGHGPGHFLHSFYEHPLGPILDAATVVSLGGSAAARAGGAVSRSAEPGSVAARLADKGIAATSREGRAPFVDPVSGREIPREFTPRPVAKLGQKGLDLFTKTGPEENRLGTFLRGMDERATTRRNLTLSQAGQWDIAGHEMQGLEPITKLTPDEAMALTLAQKGVNTPEKISAFQQMVHAESLGDPDKMARLEHKSGVSEQYVRTLGTLPDHVKALILAPSERMVDAHKVWKDRVVRQQADLGIDDAQAQAHLDTEIERLGPYLTRGEGDLHPDYPIAHTYVPSEEASGFQWHEPNALAKKIGDSEAGFRRGPMDTSIHVNKGVRYAQTVLAVKKAGHEYASSGDTFASGSFRTDSRLYLDHVAKRARENADSAWKRSEFNRVAARDPKTGDTLSFKNQEMVDDYFAGEGHPRGSMVFVNPDMAQVYFAKEVDYMERVKATVDKYLEHAGHDEVNPLEDPVLEKLLNEITDADAQAFIKTHWMSMKKQGGAIPVKDFEYRMRLAKVDEPYGSKVMRFYSRMMNRWRTAVLTLMPRWGLNTALGSIVMNTIRGVGFRDYWVAQRLHKAGFLPEDLAPEGQSTALPTGANLGHQATQEMLDSAAPGYRNGKVANFMHDMGFSLPVRAMQEGVQGIENFFRRAQFVHNLRREQRLGRDQGGRVVDLGDDGTDIALGGISDSLQKFYNDVLGDRWGGKIGEALQDPKFVSRALQETDKFMYNYSVLGPFERKAVRQLIPFWGWYKFISMAAYRIPVEMPGRMNLVRMLSQIGAEQEHDYGAMPDWLGGMVPLGEKGGKFQYLSTLGMNPFGQVLNPIGPGGPVGGAMQLGQLNPLAQGALSAFGVDTMSGGQVAISPQTAAQDQFGNYFNSEGEEKPASAISPLQRFGMGIARSFPQFRLGERYILNPMQGYGASYPESIPFVSPRPMAEAKGGTPDVLLQTLGVGLKDYELGKYQKLLPKRQRYARKSQRTQIRKLKRRTGG